MVFGIKNLRKFTKKALKKVLGRRNTKKNTQPVSYTYINPATNVVSKLSTPVNVSSLDNCFEIKNNQNDTDVQVKIINLLEHFDLHVQPKLIISKSLSIKNVKEKFVEVLTEFYNIDIYNKDKDNDNIILTKLGECITGWLKSKLNFFEINEFKIKINIDNNDKNLQKNIHKIIEKFVSVLSEYRSFFGKYETQTKKSIKVEPTYVTVPSQQGPQNSGYASIGKNASTHTHEPLLVNVEGCLNNINDPTLLVLLLTNSNLNLGKPTTILNRLRTKNQIQLIQPDYMKTRLQELLGTFEDKDINKNDNTTKVKNCVINFLESKIGNFDKNNISITQDKSKNFIDAFATLNKIFKQKIDNLNQQELQTKQKNVVHTEPKSLYYTLKRGTQTLKQTLLKRDIVKCLKKLINNNNNNNQQLMGFKTQINEALTMIENYNLDQIMINNNQLKLFVNTCNNILNAILQYISKLKIYNLHTNKTLFCFYMLFKNNIKYITITNNIMAFDIEKLPIIFDKLTNEDRKQYQYKIMNKFKYLLKTINEQIDILLNEHKNTTQQQPARPANMPNSLSRRPLPPTPLRRHSSTVYTEPYKPQNTRGNSNISA